MSHARGIAGMCAAAVGGSNGRLGPLLKPETIAEFSRIHSSAPIWSSTTRARSAWGPRCSAWRSQPSARTPSGTAARLLRPAFGDARTGVVYGYTRRRFAFPGCAAPENDRLTKAVYAADTA